MYAKTQFWLGEQLPGVIDGSPLPSFLNCASGMR